jgi:hypothetical protein
MKELNNMPITKNHAPGTRVKHSGHALQRQRDYWLSLGREPAKTYARQAYEEKAAMRGTLSDNDEKGCRVRWDDGTESACLSCMIVTA